MTERLHFHFSLSCIGEGNGNPFQCSCLEKPRDRGAWWAAIYGVAQSRTQLKWLSSSSSRPWIFSGRTDAEAEAPIFWPPDEKGWLIGKDPDAWKDWGQDGKGAIEDETVGRHPWFNGHETEQILGGGEGQGSLGTEVYGVAKGQTWQQLNNRALNINIGSQSKEEKCWL